jgi:hypothetical protein
LIVSNTDSKFNGLVGTEEGCRASSPRIFRGVFIAILVPQN